MAFHGFSFTKIRTNFEPITDDADYWRRVDFFLKIVDQLEQGEVKEDFEKMASKNQEKKKKTRNNGTKTDL